MCNESSSVRLSLSRKNGTTRRTSFLSPYLSSTTYHPMKIACSEPTSRLTPLFGTRQPQDSRGDRLEELMADNNLQYAKDASATRFNRSTAGESTPLLYSTSPVSTVRQTRRSVNVSDWTISTWSSSESVNYINRYSTSSWMDLKGQ